MRRLPLLMYAHLVVILVLMFCAVWLIGAAAYEWIWGGDSTNAWIDLGLALCMALLAAGTAHMLRFWKEYPHGDRT